MIWLVKKALPWVALVLIALWLWPVVGPLLQSVPSIPSIPSIPAFEEKAGRKYKITVQDNKVVLDQVILIAAYNAVTLSLEGKIKITRVKDGEQGFALPCTEKARLVAFSVASRFSPKEKFPFGKSILGRCEIDLQFSYPLTISSFTIESQFSPFGEKGWWNKTGYHAEGTLYLIVVTESDKQAARQKAAEALEEKKKEAAETVKAAKEKIKAAGRAIFGDVPSKVWDELVPKNKWGDNLPPMRLPKKEEKK